MTRTQAALSRTTALTSAALLVAVATPGQAQEAFDLDAITVTANAEATAVERSGSTVEVVEEEEIRAAGEVRLSEFLNRLPGVSVSNNGPAGGTSTLRIRGAGGAYIGVFVDGINVSDTASTQMAFNWANMMTSDICRVEVLKGAQSALYGSEAVAGVINITTNRATEPGLSNRYAVELGSYDTVKLGFNSSYVTDNGSVSASLTHFRTDGFSSADENLGNTEADGFEATRLSFAGEYDVSDTMTIGGAGFYQTSEGEYDTSAGDADNTSDTEEYGLRAFARFETGAVENEVALQYYAIDRRYQEGSASRYLGERYGLSYSGSVQLAPTFDLSFGGDYTREEFKSDAFGTANDGTYKTSGVFAEGAWAPSEALDVVLTLRQDDHSEFGGATTGRVSVAYRPQDDLILRAAVGTGFRAPSLYELYSNFGNPNLDPETSVSYEMGVEKRFGPDAFLRATLFRMEITDLIDFAGSSYNQIPGTSTMQGLELSGGVPLSETLHLSAAYTYTDTEDADGDRLVRVPEHEFNLSLDAELTEELNGSLTLRQVYDTLDNVPWPGSGTLALEDYTLVDLSLGYRLNDSAEAYMRVENVLDEEYQTVYGYGTSDRAVYFGLRGRF